MCLWVQCERGITEKVIYYKNRCLTFPQIACLDLYLLRLAVGDQLLNAAWPATPHTQWKPPLHEMSYIMSLFHCGKKNAWLNSREYGISLCAWMTDSYKYHCMNEKDMNTVESPPLINFYMHSGLLKCQALYISFLQTPTHHRKTW